MFDVTHLIETGGLLILFLIIFAESGMMVGFFFPGDTLLFSAGILAVKWWLRELQKQLLSTKTHTPVNF